MTIATLAAHFDAEIEYQIFKGSGQDMKMTEAGIVNDIFERISEGNTSYTLTAVTIWHVSSLGVLKIFID